MIFKGLFKQEKHWKPSKKHHTGKVRIAFAVQEIYHMKKVDSKNLSFNYTQTDMRYVAEYKNGKWDEGRMTDDPYIRMNECACVLQYAQTCFEGLKAYETADGRIVCFRPDLNAERMVSSCKRMNMPEFPKDKFVQAVKDVVKANKDFVPEYSSGGALYVRPFMYGKDPIINVVSANEFEFRIFTLPVGSYFKKALSLCVSDYDRAAPHGTGNIKAGLNYAMSLYPTMEAKKAGFNENLYLDPASRKYVEETGGTNVMFVTNDGKVITPKSDSILPSITKRSIIQIAREELGIEVEERPVEIKEISNFKECFLCGTAAVISPVRMVTDHGKEITFDTSDNEMGPVTRKLYNTLTGMQKGTVKAPEGWVVEICKA